MKFNNDEIITLSFIREKNDELIFHVNKFIGLKRLCISQSLVKKMFDIAHNEDYLNFKKCYEIISKS